MVAGFPWGWVTYPGEDGAACVSELCSCRRPPGPLSLSDLLSPWQASLIYCVSGLQMSPDFVVKTAFAFFILILLAAFG
jgi:hypothetical protein